MTMCHLERKSVVFTQKFFSELSYFFGIVSASMNNKFNSKGDSSLSLELGEESKKI